MRDLRYSSVCPAVLCTTAARLPWAVPVPEEEYVILSGERNRGEVFFIADRTRRRGALSVV